MGLLNHAFLSLVSVYCLSSINASTCEETETSHVKFELAKQSITSAKLIYPEFEDGTNDSNCTEKYSFLAHLNVALDLISEGQITCHSCPEPKVVLHDTPMDCSDIRTMGFNKSDVYQVQPRGRGVNSRQWIYVYCDMETDGGGWTVIQRRGEFRQQIDFYKDWESYKNGFGNLSQEFWLGNENIFALTNQGNYNVRFDLADFIEGYRYAVYDSFSIGNENSGYVLHIQNHTGNATDDMQMHNGNEFSTKDRQNDLRGSNRACAEEYRSAFWFQAETCGYVNVNGVYGFPRGYHNGRIFWLGWAESTLIYSVEIKIRRK